MSDRLRDPALWLFVVAVVVLVAGIGLRDPWPPDEPRFALVAQDMVRSGDWLIPRVGGVPYADKPPLFFWLVAAVYAVTGVMPVALLAPALVSGLVVLSLVFDLARRLWGHKQAVWAAGALLITFQFPLEMKAGQIDGLLCLWTTLALYGMLRHLLLGPDWRWFAIAGFACGLGVITKGVGFLPFLVFLPWFAAVRFGWSLPEIAGGYRWLLAPATFLSAIALWLVPMLIATTVSADADLLQYRDEILIRQTVTRYADAWGHIKPAWYLFTNAVPWLWLPLTFLLPWLVPAWIRDLQRRSVATLLLGGWILLVLLFFSLSAGKRSVYILPAAPALALLAAPHLAAITARRGARRMLFALAVSLALVPIALGGATLAEPDRLREFLAEPAHGTALSGIAIGIGCVSIGVAAALGVQRAPLAFAGVMVFMWTAVPLLVYPVIDSTRSGRAIIDAAASSVRPGGTLGFAGWKEQFLLQWHRPAVHFGYRRSDRQAESRDAARWVSAADGNRLILPGTMTGACFDRSRLEDLGTAHRQRWFLAKPRSVLPSCRATPGKPVTAIVYDPAGTTGVRSATQPRETA